MSLVRQNEAILRSSGERLSNIYRAMADGLVLQDDTARILECNPAAERILGLESAIKSWAVLRWIPAGIRCVSRDGGPDFRGRAPRRSDNPHGPHGSQFYEMGVYQPEQARSPGFPINTEPLTVMGMRGVREVICRFSDIKLCAKTSRNP